MSRSDQFSRIREIADSISDGSATQENYRQLESLLRESDEAMAFYRDYMSLDGSMKAEHQSDLEVVMRRLQIDELIIRPKGGTYSGQIGEMNPSSPPLLDTPRESKPQKNLYLLALLLLVCAFTIMYLMNREKGHPAQLLSGRVKSETHGIKDSGWLPTAQYEVLDQAKLETRAGFQFSLTPGSKFNFNSGTDVLFQHGEFNLKPQQIKQFKLETPMFFLQGQPDDIRLQYTENKHLSLETGDTILSISPKRWRPRHYWNFDKHSDRSQDLVGTADGVIDPSVQFNKGLVGPGAYKFNNTPSQIIHLGSGGGTALATGSFAVHDGISIEAMIHSTWNGEDYDEIFRKDKDGNLRIILSFQNDWDTKNNKVTVPNVESGPVLSFGLYLVGEGYHELELPFNGNGNQLSLRELREKPHHIVATYDCPSGIKAIYIDGKLMTSHQYKPGTRVLSGGPGSASIGNHPVSLQEAFSGTIDEVAFYDFALPPLSIQFHYEAVQKGLNYYGLSPSRRKLHEVEYHLNLPRNSNIQLDNLTGLPTSTTQKK